MCNLSTHPVSRKIILDCSDTQVETFRLVENITLNIWQVETVLGPVLSGARPLLPAHASSSASGPVLTSLASAAPESPDDPQDTQTCVGQAN